MIKKRVKSIWQGQVGLHEKYYNEALANNEGLEIKHKNDVMEIPADKVRERCKGRSEEWFQDRFSRERYRLVYFDWKPENVQMELFNSN